VEYYAQQYGGQYIGYGSSPPALTKESIMPNVERIIIASAPFQRFIMATREVYRWEDPTKTTTVLLIYMVLVYYSLLLPAMVRHQSISSNQSADHNGYSSFLVSFI
jgi:hypothetical protein